MNKQLVLPCFLLAAGMALPAAAQQGILVPHVTRLQAQTGPVTVYWGQPSTLVKAPEHHVRVADLDRNGDGRISRQELPRNHALSYEFHLVDHNYDGYITDAELAASNWQ
jgi:hypothetical protein